MVTFLSGSLASIIVVQGKVLSSIAIVIALLYQIAILVVRVMHLWSEKPVVSRFVLGLFFAGAVSSAAVYTLVIKVRFYAGVAVESMWLTFF